MALSARFALVYCYLLALVHYNSGEKTQREHCPLCLLISCVRVDVAVDAVASSDLHAHEHTGQRPDRKTMYEFACAVC